MKKLAFFLLASLALSSCSDDDSASVAGPKPSVVTLNGETRSYTYDEKGRMATIIMNGQSATFQYNDKNQVQAVSSPDGSVAFTYDQDGKYTGFTTENGQSIVVTHVGNNVYTTNGDTFGFTSNGDWKLYLGGTFNYSSGKGAFANVKHLNLLALGVVDPESVYFASRKRHESVQIQTQTIPYVVTQGEKGLPAAETVSDYAITYSYSD